MIILLEKMNEKILQVTNHDFLIYKDGNNVVMVDPASDHTNLWNAYKFSETSQFNYFSVN